jgi:hypothetical protein
MLQGDDFIFYSFFYLADAGEAKRPGSFPHKLEESGGQRKIPPNQIH